ncbi:hypothetical protein AAXB25_22665 [Paenibacillus lautus]|uniref:hypothetical protein n=1 Tax=Paenibacillus lautus TaxID=1401 RepID=UPI003D26E7D1
MLFARQRWYLHLHADSNAYHDSSMPAVADVTEGGPAAAVGPSRSVRIRMGYQKGSAPAVADDRWRSCSRRPDRADPCGSG